jgi:hypothetical protein
MDVRRVFSGVNLIAIGVVLLANLTGSLPWSVWFNVVSLWPLLIVSVGFDIMGSSTKAPWLNVVGSLILLAGFGYAVLVMPAGGTAPTWLWSVNGGGGVPFSQALTPSEAASGSEWWGLDVEDAASSVTIRPSSGEFFRMDGTSTPPVPKAGIYMVSKYSIPGPQREPGWWVRVRRGGNLDARPYGGSEMRIGLSREASWTVALSTVAGNVDADLYGLKVNRVGIKTGAGNVALRLPDGPPDVATTIETGAAAVAVRVPVTADVTVVDRCALVARDCPGFVRVGTGTPVILHRSATVDPMSEALEQGPGPPRPTNRITIDLSVAVGSVSVTTY